MLACLTDQRAGLKGMRQIRRDQHKVAILVLANMITHETHATAAHGKGQFEFRMIVPVEGEFRQAPVEQQPGSVERNANSFEPRLSNAVAAGLPGSVYATVS